MSRDATLIARKKLAFHLLYDAGWSDRAIKEVLQLGTHTVARWRSAAGMPSWPSKFGAKLDSPVAFEMYSAGASDGQIAKHFGADQSAVTRWRQRRGLSPNFDKTPPMSRHVARQASRLLSWGATALQVGEEVGRNRSTILRFRKKLKHSGLRRTGLTNRSLRAQALKDEGLQDRILDAIGRSLPLDVRQEAFTDMYLAVLEGRVMPAQIKPASAHFRSRAWSMCGSNFGPRSLDAENDDGFRLGDLLDDPGALERLEAAAELAYEMDD